MKHSYPPLSEERLVEQLRQRNEQAFHQLYDQYSPALYGVVCRIVREEEIARDVLQDAFVKIWRNIGSYDASKGRLFTWLLNIARNTAIDSLRTSHPAESIQNGDNVVYTIDRQVHTTQPNPDHMDVSDKVGQLKPERQELIDLVYFKGYTHEEAADLLGLPLGTVKTRVRAALQDLKKIFKR
ncbi:RNA polymerase sigma factor [Tellurirhabdus rosea]|uniref:RNA polymerase sigma factor n=1 Tax=Tellurirhabdus rosea TaxID=2674997 RepID=UPI0022598C58|nr:sigma-70 family RNA polymerase sigma factor [Tellurirhabdus rosea]